jgi:DNA primase
LQGVLINWAIPNGPSMNSAYNRLAIHAKGFYHKDAGAAYCINTSGTSGLHIYIPLGAKYE